LNQSLNIDSVPIGMPVFNKLTSFTCISKTVWSWCYRICSICQCCRNTF